MFGSTYNGQFEDVEGVNDMVGEPLPCLAKCRESLRPGSKGSQQGSGFCWPGGRHHPEAVCKVTCHSSCCWAHATAARRDAC